MKNSFVILGLLLGVYSFVPCKKDKVKIVSYTRTIVHAGMRGGMNGTMFTVKILNSHKGISIDSLHLTYGYSIPLHLESDRMDVNGNPIANADTLVFVAVMSDLQLADFTRNPKLSSGTSQPSNVDELGYWTIDAVHHWQKLPPAKITAPLNMP